MRRFTRMVVALGALRGLRKRRREERRAGERTPKERIVEPGAPQPRSELVVAGLLLLCAAFAAAFVVIYAVDRIPSQTQYLGLALGGALLALAAALITTAKHVVVTEELDEDYPGEHPAEQEEVARIVAEAGTPITRKKLLGGAAAVAGTAMGAALIAPAAGLGPALSSHILLETPWRRGRRVVREDNVPVKASDIEQGNFYTGFAEGAPHDLLGAPIVIVRLDPEELKLPPERRDWAPDGIVAYSKICTHAGCAINLYRKPTFPDVDAKPALVCPCHYSTFDPAAAGEVLFGPAGRPLPQLPLMVDRKGELRAAGNYSGPPGPSWWGVRWWKARFVKQ